MGLVHHIAGCYDCGKEWGARNARGLAAQHAYRTGHTTWAEMGYRDEYGPNAYNSKARAEPPQSAPKPG